MRGSVSTDLREYGQSPLRSTFPFETHNEFGLNRRAITVAQEEARREAEYMEKIQEHLRFLDTQERATREKRDDRNSRMRKDLNTQVRAGCSWLGRLPPSSGWVVSSS